MLTLTLPTMTCGACEKRVRKALDSLPVPPAVAVDLPGKTITLTGTIDRDAAISALTKAGYAPAEV